MNGRLEFDSAPEAPEPMLLHLVSVFAVEELDAALFRNLANVGKTMPEIFRVCLDGALRASAPLRIRESRLPDMPACVASQIMPVRCLIEKAI